MVGDTLENDIVPAIDAGLNTIWFNRTVNQNSTNTDFHSIKQLSELRD